MKKTIKFKNESVAKDFVKSLADERNITGTIAAEKENFVVEYSLSTAQIEMDKPEEKHENCVSKSEFEMMAMDIQWMSQWMSNRMNALGEALWEHQSNGHLPPIKGAGKMAEALKKIGISDDYEVKPPTIYASRGVINVSLEPKSE